MWVSLPQSWRHKGVEMSTVRKKKKKPDRDFNVLLKSMSLVFGCDVEPFYSWMPEEPCTALGID